MIMRIAFDQGSADRGPGDHESAGRQFDALLDRVVGCARIAWALDDGVQPGGVRLGGGRPEGSAPPMRDDADLHAALAAACARARDAGLRVEQVLIRLKAAWARNEEGPRSPAGRAVVTPWFPVAHPAAPDGQDQLARLVTLCIKEFYRSDAATRPVMDAHHPIRRSTP